MSEEKENHEPIDLLAFTAQLESLTEEELNDETILDKLNHVTNDFNYHVFFINAVNETDNRRINLAMFLTQLFARYSKPQIFFFLGAALLILIIQGVCSLFTLNATVHFLLGLLMAIIMVLFAIVTLNYVIAALTDIWRLKRCYCTAGYQVTPKKDESSEGEIPTPELIAYKDYDGMIRTLRFPEDYKKYLSEPVLILYLDKNDPYKVTFFSDLPGSISYDSNTQTYAQSWKGAIFALVPVAMIIMYAISLYLGSGQ